MLQCDPLRKISIIHTTREIDFFGLVQTLCEVGVILIPKSNRGITKQETYRPCRHKTHKQQNTNKQTPMMQWCLKKNPKHLCVCVCVCVYIYMCVCVCVCIYIYIYMIKYDLSQESKCFKTQKSISTIHYITRIEDKEHMIFSIDTEKALIKLNAISQLKNLE